MKVYLAASFPRHKEMREKAEQLKKLGYQVVSRWWEDPRPYNDLRDDLERTQKACQDLADLLGADHIIIVLDDIKQLQSRGGYHTELGMAYILSLTSRKIQITLVGARRNIFCYLPAIQHFPSWENMILHMSLDRDIGPS